ncbi:N-6 DNA methylase [Marinicella rhabdoformis]|uniref:N-6 DNA methylase n=1 Tax=Marinicella rhabdoformis TaxID=2580566 RepID=UPI001C553F0E|nr:N-6 DNA methylase [Marinicella rhabdoformis]
MNKAKIYLQTLGYSDKSLVLDYRLESGRFIDLAIFEGTKILGILEIISPSKLNLKEVDELPYNRNIRKAQSVADELGCDFFIIYNGVDFKWMKTGSTGRVLIIPEKFVNRENKDEGNKENQVQNILIRTLEFLRANSHNTNYEMDLLYVLLKKFDEQTNYLVEPYFASLYEKCPVNQFEVIDEAIRIISKLDIQEVRSCHKILSFIDELLSARNRELFVPKWLYLFMLKMSIIDTTDKIYNFFCRDGSILEEAKNLGISNITLVDSDNKSLLWARLRAILLNHSSEQIQLVRGIHKGNFNVKDNHIDSIIIAPPFNVKFNNEINQKHGYYSKLDSSGVFAMECLNILKPGGVLAIVVPDGFLFSSSAKNSRTILRKSARIKAIISLPKTTFSSYSFVSSSLIVLHKGESIKNDSIFIGKINNDSNTKKTTSETDLILENYKSHKSNSKFDQNKNSFFINQIDDENWHHSKYAFELFSNIKDSYSENITLVPLKELTTRIGKGSGFVSNKNGKLAYISPSNIREMDLKLDNLLYAKNNSMIKFFEIEMHDVLINAISSHRGSAAVVEDRSLVGLGANRHVIILRPNKNLVDPYFLAMIINSDQVRKQLFDFSTGSVIPSLTLKNIKNLLIPLPSLNEQKEIRAQYISQKNNLEKAKKEVSGMKRNIKELINNIGK